MLVTQALRAPSRKWGKPACVLSLDPNYLVV